MVVNERLESWFNLISRKQRESHQLTTDRTSRFICFVQARESEILNLPVDTLGKVEETSHVASGRKLEKNSRESKLGI
jgi:hypothetical protein